MLTLATLALALGACGDDDPTGVDDGLCLDPVNAFPTPVASSTSAFSEIDDDFVSVTFHPSFTFSFFGTDYSSVFLNTNGGMTFGAGYWWYDVAATDVTNPAIAVFWGDMDASAHGADTRAAQMLYRSCADAFTVTYTNYQDNDDPTWNNTATVTLAADGTITIQYGSVTSSDILVGVFDGTHTDDQYVALASSYPGYSTDGTGTILYDYWGAGPGHGNELSSQSITFTP